MRTATFLFCLIFAATLCAAQTARQISGAGITGALYRYENFPTKTTDARNIDVWLPPDYEKNSKKRYTVVYMHDGQNLFNPKDAANGVDWGVDETMTRLIESGEIKAAIIVGIWHTPKRTLEFIPQKAFSNKRRAALEEDAKTLALAHPETGSDNYLRFLVDELKPFVDRTYRTLPDRKNTFVAGSSMGGLMSLYALSEYPDVFGGAACISTHFPLGKGAMLDYMAKHLPAPKTHRIYFDYGTKTLDKDYEPYQKRADELMRKKGYKAGKNWTTRRFEGDDHTEKSWRARVDVPLSFLLGK